MDAFLISLLEHYQMTLEDLRSRKLPGSFQNLAAPDGDDKFELVIQRLRQASEKKEKTVIYGDYDVDGLTSTCILKRALDELGLNPGYFIPSRYREGYGIVKERVHDFKKKGYQLIITVDNGITANEAVSEAIALGMDVVIIDHHELPSVLPETPYIFHQLLSRFIPYNCSAASLCFFVANRLLGRMDEYLATLAGIAVFSDVMPLVGNNLELAKLSLSFLKKYQYRNLLSLILNKSDEISYDDLSFQVIPALNSPGRIESDVMATNKACALLIQKDDPDRIRLLSTYILSVNEKRKKLVKETKIQDDGLFESSHSFSAKEDGPSGLCGLVANRLLREKKKCILILSADECNPDRLVGSIRAPAGYDFTQFLKKNEKYFIASGGHPQACGITILKKDYFQVVLLFSTEAERQALFVKEGRDESIPISLADLNGRNYQTFQSFLPFGEGHPSPRFEITVDKKDVLLSASGRASFVYNKDRTAKITYFGIPDVLKDREGTITFLGDFRKEVFQGKVSYVLLSNVSK